MQACQAIIDNKEALRAIGLVALLGAEAWLGKTDKVRASSLLEALYNLVVKRGTEAPAKPSLEDDNGKAL